MALSQLADIEERQGADPTKTLERLVAVEDTPYFQVRAIPELVPTETYEARLKLARRTDGERKIKLLSGAVDGYGKYRDATWPTIKRYAEVDPSASYGGESLQEATQKLELAAAAATELAQTYRARGETDLADAAAAEATKFKEALSGGDK
jgi:hypothetical protein